MEYLVDFNTKYKLIAIESTGPCQISLRERTLAETSVQRNKVVMAVEKLKVHFDSFRRNDARYVRQTIAG